MDVRRKKTDYHYLCVHNAYCKNGKPTLRLQKCILGVIHNISCIMINSIDKK